MQRVQPLKECSQCAAFKANGDQCKNRTCKSTFCWIHLKYQRGLRIKPSRTGFGDGLFTTRRFGANQRIALYGGEKMDRAEMDRLYTGDNHPHYTICNGDAPTSHCVDGRKTNSSAARYINSSRGTASTNNARITHNRRGGVTTFSMKTFNRPIMPDREIFANYGNAYNL